VHGDVISFVALDLILRITFSGVMHVTFVLHVLRVFIDDNAFNISGFGVPSDMVSNSELLHHSRSFQDTGRSGAWSGEVADRTQTGPSSTFTSQHRSPIAASPRTISPSAIRTMLACQGQQIAPILNELGSGAGQLPGDILPTVTIHQLLCVGAKALDSQRYLPQATPGPAAKGAPATASTWSWIGRLTLAAAFTAVVA
jgi:hypothetical protein